MLCFAILSALQFSVFFLFLFSFFLLSFFLFPLLQRTAHCIVAQRDTQHNQFDAAKLAVHVFFCIKPALSSVTLVGTQSCAAKAASSHGYCRACVPGQHCEKLSLANLALRLTVTGTPSLRLQASVGRCRFIESNRREQEKGHGACQS